MIDTILRLPKLRTVTVNIWNHDYESRIWNPSEECRRSIKRGDNIRHMLMQMSEDTLWYTEYTSSFEQIRRERARSQGKALTWKFEMDLRRTPCSIFHRRFYAKTADPRSFFQDLSQKTGGEVWIEGLKCYENGSDRARIDESIFVENIGRIFCEDPANANVAYT